MSPEMTVVYMLGGLVVLIGLLIVYGVQQYRGNESQRVAIIALIPLDTLQRRARNFSLAAGIGLMGYGLLKFGVHLGRVATSGLSGFANVRGLVSGDLQTDRLFFACTLLLATTLLVCGLFALRRSVIALWLGAVAISFDALISLAIALALFGDSRVKNGAFLVFAAVSIPAMVWSLNVVAIQQQLLAAQKARLDEQAATGKGST